MGMAGIYGKRILFIFFSTILLGNFFSTFSIYTSVNDEACTIKKAHTNPCSFVQVEGVLYEIPEEIDASFDSYHIPSIHTAYVPITQLVIQPFFLDEAYVPYKTRPPSETELARSHLLS